MKGLIIFAWVVLIICLVVGAMQSKEEKEIMPASVSQERASIEPPKPPVQIVEKPEPERQIVPPAAPIAAVKSRPATFRHKSNDTDGEIFHFQPEKQYYAVIIEEVVEEEVIP